MESPKVHEQTEIAIFGAVKSALAQLKSEYGDRVYDVTTFAGLTDAKQARADVRKWRTTLEKARKAEKAQYLEAGRRLDKGAKELTEELLAIETPIDQIIKKEEAKKAEGKRLREEAEANRIAKILGEIDDIAATPARFAYSEASEVERVVNDFTKYEPKVDDGFFAEFTQRAKETMATAKAELVELLNQALAREEEAKRILEEKLAIEVEKEALAKAKAEAEAEKAASDAMIAKAQADIDKERKRLAQEQADLAEAKALAEDAAKDKEISEDSVEKAVDEMIEGYKPEGKALKGITHVVTSEYFYPSQGEALEAIYQICEGILGDDIAIERIGKIAFENMGEE